MTLQFLSKYAVIGIEWKSDAENWIVNVVIFVQFVRRMDTEYFNVHQIRNDYSTTVHVPQLVQQSASSMIKQFLQWLFLKQLYHLTNRRYQLHRHLPILLHLCFSNRKGVFHKHRASLTLLHRHLSVWHYLLRSTHVSDSLLTFAIDTSLYGICFTCHSNTYCYADTSLYGIISSDKQQSGYADPSLYGITCSDKSRSTS